MLPVILKAPLLSSLALALVGSTIAQDSGPPESNLILVGTFYDLSDAIGERVWAGWGDAPEAVLLIGESREFLFRHPQPTADFDSVGHDARLGTILSRPRVFDRALLAAFPAVGGVPTIVVGEPAALGLSPTDWVLSLMHEHFHQIQMSQPAYGAMVGALDLSEGDSTGMWMLQYPFPYADAEVSQHLTERCSTLAAVLEAPGADSFKRLLSAYKEVLASTPSRLSEKDLRYLTFQIWQEGVARYVELRSADIAADRFEPRDSFTSLPGYRSFDEAANDRLESLRRELRSGGGTAVAGRTLFYPLGAGEAIALDRAGIAWRDGYLENVRVFEQAFREPTEALKR